MSKPKAGALSSRKCSIRALAKSTNSEVNDWALYVWYGGNAFTLMGVKKFFRLLPKTK